MNLIPFEPVEDTASTEVVEKNARRMTFTKQQALRDIAPGSGAYFNEVGENSSKKNERYFMTVVKILTHNTQGDTREPDWRKAFFGSHYDRLLAVKTKYDPDDLLWCRNCVGSDKWVEQNDGGICKASRV